MAEYITSPVFLFNQLANLYWSGIVNARYSRCQGEPLRTAAAGLLHASWQAPFLAIKALKHSWKNKYYTFKMSC